MRLVKSYARLMSLPAEYITENDSIEYPDVRFEYCDGVGLLKRIEWAARISHRSEDKVTPDSWKRFLTHVVIEKGDWSVTEHASVSVDFLVDRGITHEIVRHRLFSYTQESTRFVNYEKKMPPSFVDPFIDAYVGSIHQNDVWMYAMDNAEDNYRELVQSGVPPQIARSVLPNALASRLIMTGNLRNWRHFLIMRTTKEAHPQMKEVTIPLLEEFQQKIPLLFDDIVPEQFQKEAIRKGK